jgi:hypothetical protein
MLKTVSRRVQINDTRRDRTIQDISSTFQQALYASFS